MTTVLNPTTGEPAFEVEAVPPHEAAESLEEAKSAQDAWAQSGGARRAELLTDAASRLAADVGLPALLVEDVGKPIAEARAEVERAAAILRYVASLAFAPQGELFEDAAGSSIRVTRAARGAAVLITPWNFPLAIPAWKLAPALQAGNAVRHKPATQASRIAKRLTEHLHAAGVPADVVRTVEGGVHTANALLDAGPDVVSFTGSTATGRLISTRLAGRFVPLQLEMGGKNAVFVSAASEVESASRIVLTGAMGYAGQKCTATSLVFVAENISDHFFDTLLRQARELVVGDPAAEHTVVGPLISLAHRDEVARRLTDATGRGVQIELGGKPLDRPGAFIQPTLLVGGSANDEVHRDEHFAPVLSVQPVANGTEAAARINALPYGLVAGVVSPLRAEVEEFAAHVDTGLVRVNAPTTGLEPHVPFGGRKESSFGPREQGRAGLEFFSETRTIYG